jgi:hypothetical protein
MSYWYILSQDYIHEYKRVTFFSPYEFATHSWANIQRNIHQHTQHILANPCLQEHYL